MRVGQGVGGFPLVPLLYADTRCGGDVFCCSQRPMHSGTAPPTMTTRRLPGAQRVVRSTDAQLAADLDELISNVQTTLARVIEGEHDEASAHPSEQLPDGKAPVVKGVEPKFLGYVSKELTTIRDIYGDAGAHGHAGHHHDQRGGNRNHGGGSGGTDADEGAGSAFALLAKGSRRGKTGSRVDDDGVADDLHPRLLLLSSKVRAQQCR